MTLLEGFDIGAAQAAVENLDQVLIGLDNGLFHFLHGDLTDAAVHSCFHVLYLQLKMNQAP